MSALKKIEKKLGLDKKKELRPVSYGDLLKRLQKMNKEQLEMSLSVCDASDEIFAVQRLYWSDADGVLDGKHLILELLRGEKI